MPRLSPINLKRLRFDKYDINEPRTKKRRIFKANIQLEDSCFDLLKFEMEMFFEINVRSKLRNELSVLIDLIRFLNNGSIEYVLETVTHIINTTQFSFNKVIAKSIRDCITKCMMVFDQVELQNNLQLIFYALGDDISLEDMYNDTGHNLKIVIYLKK